MDDFANKSFDVTMLGELETKREWYIGVLGATVCYGLILWLL
ncbi:MULTISPECIES: hypothetical protein [unclassified Limnobacter]|jgi:hypothetical protein|nr:MULTISPECIES: hypothetical protein [unclassified Limnobacter]